MAPIRAEQTGGNRAYRTQNTRRVLLRKDSSVSLYCLDWDNVGRSQTIDIVDAVTGTTLDTRMVSAFNGGKYLTWTLKGHLQIRFAQTAGPNAVVSGIFFDTSLQNTHAPAPAWAEGVIPTDAFSLGGIGPSAADSVNLASGELENHPGADMAVRNPVGPNAVYERMYRSSRAIAGYASPGLSLGWVDSYDVTVSGPSVSGTWGALTLVYPNGAVETLTPNLSQGVPTGTLSPPSGAPYLVTGSPGTTGQWTALTLTFKDKATWRFTPDPNNANHYLLTRIANLLNRYLTINRDAANGNRITSIVNDANPTLTLLTFGYSGSYLNSLTDAYGRRVLYTFSPVAFTTCLTAVSQMAPATTGPFNTQWQYGYLSLSGYPFLNSVGVPDPTGGTGIRSHPIYYDDTARVTSLVDANGGQRVLTYNPTNTQVSVKDINGNLVESWTQKLGSRDVDTGSVDANTQATRIDYGDPNNLYQPTGVTNKNNQTSTLTYDAFGNVLTANTPNNGGLLVTTNTYDYSSLASGRLTQTQVAAKTLSQTLLGSKTPTKFTYFSSGLLQSVFTPTPGVNAQSSAWVHTDYTYTALGNVATVSMPGPDPGNLAPPGPGTVATVTYNYTFDPLDNTTKTEALGEPLTVTNSNGSIQHFRYDGAGRITQTIDSLGNRTYFEFNNADQITRVTYPFTGETGNLPAHTDTAYLYPGGPVLSVTIYNESGVIVRQVTRNGGNEDELKSVSGSVVAQNSAYDSQYRLKQLTDGNNHAFQHTYDNVGNLQKTTLPLYNASTGYDSAQGQFDADHNLTQSTDGRGVIVHYSLAADDSRLTGVTFPDATKNVSLLYDMFGRVSHKSDGAGSTDYVYNDADLITSILVTFPNVPTQSVSYTYFPDGSRATMTTPVGTYSYRYDLGSRLTDVTCPWLGGQYHYDYDADDRLIHQHQLKADTTYLYNARSRQVELHNYYRPADVALPNVPLTDYTIYHDEAGNITQLYSPFGTINYTYDNQDRLTQETSQRNAAYNTSFPNYAYSFVSDAANNLTTLRGVAKTYNADNQLTGNVFDGNGNPTTYSAKTLTFDAQDNLTSLSSTLTQGALSFGYFSDGRRAWKQNGSNRTYFLYDGASVVCEVDGSGNALVGYGRGANGLMQTYFARPNTNRYITVQDTLNPPPPLVLSYTFDPLGNVVMRHGQYAAPQTAQPGAPDLQHHSV